MQGKSIGNTFNIHNLKQCVKFMFKIRVIEPYPKKKSHKKFRKVAHLQ